MSADWALLKHAVLAATLVSPEWAASLPYFAAARRMLRQLGDAALRGDRSPKLPLTVWWCDVPEMATDTLTVGNEHLPDGRVRPMALLGRYAVFFPVLPGSVAPPAMQPCTTAQVDLGLAVPEFGAF